MEPSGARTLSGFDPEAEDGGAFLIGVEATPRARRRQPFKTARLATTVAMAVYVGAALAVIALVVAVCRRGAVAANSARASLRLSQRRTRCAAANFTGVFGGRAEQELELPEGPGEVELPCPDGSSNSSGLATFACAPSGSWALQHTTCYDCLATHQAVEETGAYVNPGAGLHGHTVRVACELDGGVGNSGQALMNCSGRRWRVLSHKCSSRCAAAPVHINFGGDVGRAAYNVSAGQGFEELRCPRSSPQPGGRVLLACRPTGAAEHFRWQLVRQTCQACAAGSAVLALAGESAVLSLRGGRLDENLTLPCDFAGGRSYPWGAVSLRCEASGWRLEAATCRATACLAEQRMVRMRYRYLGMSDVLDWPLDLPDADPGVRDVPCASYLGNATARCGRDGHWTVLRERCFI